MDIVLPAALGPHSLGYTVKDYFDAAAANYKARSTDSLWAWQRKRECHAVFELLGLVKEQDVLDLGCGSGFYTELCLRNQARKVIGVDFSQQMVAQLSPYVTGIVADAAEVKLDAPVSRIVCTGLLEFVSMPAKVLRNARGLITRDGTLVCLVPPASVGGFLYRLFHRTHGIKITLFSDRRFREIAEKSGWSVQSTLNVFPYSMVYCLKPVS